MSHTAAQSFVSPLPPLRVGKTLTVFPPVLQAPMASLTNRATRILAEEQGCGMAVNEWVPASSVAAQNRFALRKLARGSDKPFAIQLFGREPRAMERAAALAMQGGAELVDINMGCPGKKVRSGSTGAALMREPALAVELVEAACAGVDGQIPISVKMRAGWDDQQKNAPELAARVSAAGAAMITVHGRTRQQRYSGAVDLAIIAEVKRAVAVPVIANGDIVDRPTMERALRETGADGVMVGRAALGNPWIFAELACHFTGDPPPDRPQAAARVEMLRRHLSCHLQGVEGERAARSAVIEMRKFARWYLEGLPDAESWRRRINRTSTLPAMQELLVAYCEELATA